MKDDAEYKKLLDAAECRAQADWLIGMNGTRAFTGTYFKKLNIGRVMTPTLAMIVERQEAIARWRIAKDLGIKKEDLEEDYSLKKTFKIDYPDEKQR